MLQDIKEILFSEEVINAKIKELAERISDDYKERDLLVVGVLKGSVIFTADLIKNIKIPCEIDFMAVSSYGNATESSGVVRILKDLDYCVEGKDILIVEGRYTRSGEGNDLFANAKSISRIIVPSKNAFNKKTEIEQAIRKYAENKLILLMVGPTAKIIVSDLKLDDDFPNQMIDIGHIDSEYEWFKMQAKDKVKIPHKHTAEFNNDDDKVTLMNDKVYLSQVKEVIK